MKGIMMLHASAAAPVAAAAAAAATSAAADSAASVRTRASAIQSTVLQK